MSGRRVKRIRKVFEQQSKLKMGVDEASKSMYKTAWRSFKKSLKRRY